MVRDKRRIHMKTGTVIGAVVIAPLIVALAAGALFGWAFWPTFWLALGFGLLVRSTTTVNK